MSEPEESLAAPDSTTREQRVGFSHGDDVLQHRDGKYYLGTVVEVDLARERCLVKFLDNTSSWSLFRELTKLAMPDSDVMCVLCKKSQPKTDNDIIVCDKCGRGYHQMCHQPEISKPEPGKDIHWICKRCTDSQSRTRESCEPKNSMVKASIRKVCSGRDQPQPPPDDMTKLPYDPDMLNWDNHHRVNAEQIYCYCGLNGEWYAQMLQCGRCKQWFHEKCIRCLTYPLYSGDRFYVFVCSMCNHGKEFVRRLEMKWVDLVHLMLYNLTVYNAKKYYDLDTVIIPYANDNWLTLQLPPRVGVFNIGISSVSPTHLVMRGTLYQNSEAEQSSCPSPPPLTESSQSIESPTPPTSVSGPPTPPAATSGISELSVPSSVDLMHPLPPSTPYNPCPITLPLPLTPVISQPPVVRPAKRQLSEKDIIVDRNGQVKRRRQHRRGRPPPPDPQPQRKSSMSSSPKCSPVKQSAPDISLDDQRLFDFVDITIK